MKPNQVLAAGWIRRFHPATDVSHRLICFPYAGGTATYFAPLSRLLSPVAEVLAIQYPGRHDRRGEPTIDDLEALVELIVAELRPWTDRPLTFFGHSMGAIVAFEVARRLTGGSVEAGTGAQHPGLTGLFVSGRRAPSRYRRERSHQLDDEGLLAVVRQLAGANARLPGFEPFARLALPTIRSDYRAAETYRYRPGPELTCPIFALVGDNDPMTTVEEASCWRGHTTGEFELTVFPGGHFYLDDRWVDVFDVIARHLATH